MEAGKEMFSFRPNDLSRARPDRKGEGTQHPRRIFDRWERPHRAAGISWLLLFLPGDKKAEPAQGLPMRVHFSRLADENSYRPLRSLHFSFLTRYSIQSITASNAICGRWLNYLFMANGFRTSVVVQI